MLKKWIVLMPLLFSSAASLAAEYWIDVRIPQQYNQSHIEGALNVPLAGLERRIGDEVESKNDTLHLYCNSGRQSAAAKRVLEELGYTEVIDEGGLSKVLSERPDLRPAG